MPSARILIAIFALVSLAASSGAQAQVSRPLVGNEREHQVVAGENLYQIALSYGLAIEHFAFANGLPVGLAVPAGKKLVVPSRRVLPASPPDDGIVLNLPERGLFLFRQGEFEKFYPCAIGQPGRFATPLGNYKLASRVVNPTWLPPEWAGLGEDTVVPAGPDNPLGDRWMGLSAPGLGLHSTTSPASIGAAASHGCMRMYPTMARELFDKVKVGMPVRIIYEPVKLGRDEQGLYVVVYPDVYGRADLSDSLQALLRKEGILEFFDEKMLSSLVAKPSGKPERMIDLRPRLQEPSAEGGDLALCNGRLWISSQGLKNLGFEVEFHAAARSLEIRHQARTLEVALPSTDKPEPAEDPGEETLKAAEDPNAVDDTLEESDAPEETPETSPELPVETPAAKNAVEVVNWAGVSYFPVRDFFKFFEMEITWQGDSQTLVVSL